MLHRITRMTAARLAAGVAILAGALALAGCQEKGTLTPIAPRTPALQTSGFISLNSALTPLESGMGYRVYLPPQYNADSVDVLYPVVFMLHGYGGSANTFIDAGAAQVAEDMMNRGEIKPMILVFPYSGGIAPTTGSSFYTDGGLGAYQSYIVSTLMPKIMQTYNVDTTKVGVSGHSMGGYGAMKLALKYPTKFTSVCSHSAPLDFTQVVAPSMLSRLARENSRVNTLTGERTYSTRLDSLAFVNSGGYLSVVSISLSLAFAYEQSCSDGRFLSPLLTDPKGYTLASAGVACPGVPSAKAVLGFQYPIILNGDGTGTVDQPVFDKFLANDCLSLLTSAAQANDATYAAFKNLRVYMDCGLYDDDNPADDGVGFNILPACRAFDAKLSTLGIGHRYVEYAGAHSSQVYYHIDDDLRWHDAAFRKLPAPAAAPAGGGISLRLPSEARRATVAALPLRTADRVAMVLAASR